MPMEAASPMLYEHPIKKVTLQSGIRMLVELRDMYLDPAFQRRYKAARKKSVHVAKALSVQALVLPNYGFEGTAKGSIQMRNQVDKMAESGPPLKKIQADIWRLLQFREPLPPSEGRLALQPLGRVPAWADLSIMGLHTMCNGGGCK